jgi:hypothetical protein
MTSRTTLNLDAQVLADAKKLAIDSKLTLTKLVEDALRETLARANSSDPKPPFKLHTIGYSKLNPDIDFSNSAALTELMDEEDKASAIDHF